MPKRGRDGASKASAAKRRKRAVSRYGAAAVAKYYSPSSRYNRKFVGQRETGYVDLASANYGMDTTGTVTLVATIPQGTSVSQRVGKKCVYKSFQIRGFASNNSTTAINDCAWMLVYDKRPTGALPSITDILVTASSRSFNNDVNSNRFRILRRWDKQLVGTSTTPADGVACTVDEYVKCKLPIEFNAAGTGAIGDISLGAVYLVTCGSNAAGLTAAALVIGIRTRFIDV